MIAPARTFRRPQPTWHRVFLAMLPAILRYLRVAFRHLHGEARAEAIQEAIANCCLAVARLAQLGKLDLAYPSVLARFAIAQVREGRRVGGRLNCRDVLSEYAQRRKRFGVERLDKFDEESGAWREAVIHDTRSAAVPEIVSFRVDFADWLGSLSRRNRRIAERLALSHTTGEVARKFGVTAGRVSQLRGEFAESWRQFEEEDR